MSEGWSQDSQDVRTVTLVVDPDCQFLGGVTEKGGVSKDVYRLAADGG